MAVGSSNHAPHKGRLLAASAPVLLIAVGFIDPGKWVAAIDSGSRFGTDLVPFLLLFNFFAILCYYLSFHIGVITGRNLAQICSEEYDTLTCVFLGVQAELSVVCLDLTMILGIAQGLNMILGIDLFTCVLLTAFNAVLYPLFSSLVESSKVKPLVVYIAGITFVCYVLGMLISLPRFPVNMNGFLSKLSGESAFALMSLLGANVMPHHFYLHSSIVQRYQEPNGSPKGVWSHDNLVVTLTISSGIFLVNYVLMSSAANAFYNSGLGLLTFQDSMSLVDQVFRNPVMSFAAFVILLLANQITSLSWEFCGEGEETILHDFFKMDLPVWLHRATVRIFAIVPALYCLWHSGAEGMYHMLVCTQVIVALLLPSSMIPLFRIASSRNIMGVSKISPVLEFVVLLTFMGVLGLEIIFMVEMIFGESDWVANLQWGMGNTTSIAYVLLLLIACISLSFMLWLAATPLKSVTAAADSQPLGWSSQQAEHNSYKKIEENDVSETENEDPVGKQDFLPQALKNREDKPTANYDIGLPETVMDSVQEPYLTTIQENFTVNTPVTLSRDHHGLEQSVATSELVSVSSVGSRDCDIPSLETSPVKSEVIDPVDNSSKEGDTWELGESSKDAPPTTQEGPGSLRSLSGKSEDGGSSIGSMSRLSGLGRAARRQFAAALDEFWGQFYDLHGQLTEEAKGRKLDLILSGESKPYLSQTKADSASKDLAVPLCPPGFAVSGISSNPGLYNASNQQKFRNSLDSACRFPGVSGSIWSNQTPVLDRYMRGSNRAMLDAGERRYQSLRLPPSSDALEYQPATVHGYEIASYHNRMGKDRSDYVTSQLGSVPQKSPSLVPNNYGDPRVFSFGQKSTNVHNSLQQSTFQNLAVQRNAFMQSDNLQYDLYTAGSIENSESQNNAKKYHSSPDISRLSIPLRNAHLSGRTTQWDIPKTSTGFGTSVGSTTHGQPSYASMGSGKGAPLAFDELSPSRAYTDAFSRGLNSGYSTGSLWARQPFEQFGVANNKTMSRRSEEPGIQTSLVASEPEPLSLAELESKMLRSLRICILKLLKLEGSESLFKPNDGVDEDLIDRVGTRERFFYEVESQDLKQATHLGDSQNPYSERKPGATMRGDDAIFADMVSSVPQCGEGCVWKVDLIVSFGVWCIHRVLVLSLMESRPELWGKYTYVLNRLQGVIQLAFFKPRTPMTSCFCLQVPASYQARSSPPVAGNSSLPPAAARPAKGKVTTAATLLDIIKDVEIAISCRKGRSGTAAGDVAFPKGKENLASVLKRYKRRLTSKQVGNNDGGPGTRKLQSQASYGS